MKIAITGHSRGIGHELSNVFQSNGHEVIGFSVNNGYNISLEDARSKIISQVSDCDVFINNAYHPVYQTELLSSMIDKWKGTTKLIVNIGSTSMFTQLDKAPAASVVPADYIAAKKAQSEIIMSRLGVAEPRLLNIVAGPVDTEMGKFLDCLKIDPKKLAELIYILVNFKDSISVKQIVVDAPGLNGKDIKVKQ